MSFQKAASKGFPPFGKGFTKKKDGSFMTNESDSIILTHIRPENI